MVRMPVMMVRAAVLLMLLGVAPGVVAGGQASEIASGSAGPGSCEDPWLPQPGSGEPGGEDPAPPPTQAPVAQATGVPGEAIRLGGRWRRIADPPFAAMNPRMVLAGDQILMVDVRERRTATYDLGVDRWRELARPPKDIRLAVHGAHGWTGRELVFPFLVKPDGEPARLTGLAVSPASGWRRLPSVDLDQPWSSRPGSVNGVSWTGERLVLLTSTRVVAAYDPNADCWELLPPLPGGGHAWNVYWTGSTILAETRSERGILLTGFDPGDREWEEPRETPITDMWAAPEGALWHEGRLAYVTWHSGGLEGTLDALYAPATGEWQVFEHGCHVAGVNPTQAGPLWVAGSGRQALDPETWQCYDLPRRPRQLLGGGVAWTGEELIVVSGGPGDLQPPKRHSYAYRIIDRVPRPSAGGATGSSETPGDSAPGGAPSVPGAVEALDCDFPGRPHVVRDEWGYLSSFDDPVEARDAVLDEGFVIPISGYHELAANDTAVLYGFQNRGKVKIAVRVRSPSGDGERWLPEQLADCRLSEFGRRADLGPGKWLWANRRDRTILEHRGAGHCDWQSARILQWRRPDARRGPQATRTYVRDPRGRFRDRSRVSYLARTTLPRDARPTGYRRDGAALWIAADGRAVYVIRGAQVERWPLVPGGIACA